MKRAFALALTVLMVAATGCTERQAAEESDPTPTAAVAAPVPETPAPTPTPEPTEEPEETEKPEVTRDPNAENRNPLNGAPLDGEYTARPFVCMLNNHKDALPQCGVSDADILYEVLVEGGITRMMGVFSDIRSVERLEAVRSIRPYYLDLAISYGAVICHAGGSDEAYSRISSEHLQNVDGVRGGDYALSVFERDQDRLSQNIALEHTMFTDGKRLYDTAVDLGYPVTVDETYDSGLYFVEDGTPEDGEDASAFSVKFGYKTTDFTYDEDTGLYSAVQPQYRLDYVDGNTGDPVTFRNVIVISAPVRTVDGYGRLAIDTTAGGEGYFICGGKYVPITWERNNGKPFHYYLEDGDNLELGAGHTYIAIVPTQRGGVDFG